MAITAEQRELRRRYICASDTPALFDLDPWRTLAQLYHEKTSTYERPAGEAAFAGSILEGAVLDWFRHKKGLSGQRDEMIVHANGIMAANLDEWNMAERWIAEAKSTGITGPCDEEYGRAGTQQLPRRVILQCHAQMACAGPEFVKVWVPVLRGGKGFGLYYVERLPELVTMIEDRAAWFMQKHVIPMIPPEQSTAQAA